MIYPPINELIKKTGNRYNLVVATAKRAREIAQNEKNSEKEKPGELSVLEMRIKERMEKKPIKKAMKPIIKTLDELIHDEIIVLNRSEIYKEDVMSEETEKVLALPSENDIMSLDDYNYDASISLDDEV